MQRVMFANMGVLDLGLVTTMGVSVKVTDSPIGYFGTGLKFAVACLLRSGADVTIWVKGEPHHMTWAPREFRKTLHNVVQMDGRDLGYTLDLGRDWQPWQAYRELRCNAIDEEAYEITEDMVDLRMWDTVIEVRGSVIVQCHRERDQYFCEGREVVAECASGQILRGGSNMLFYRGVAIGHLQKPALYSYNLLSKIDLTEDRTYKYGWQALTTVAAILANCESHDAITTALLAEDGTTEHDLEYNNVWITGPMFQQVVRENRANARLNQTALRKWEASAPAEDIFRAVELDELELESLRLARELVVACDPDFPVDLEATFVASLGDGVLGLLRDGHIYISRGAFTMGTLILAGTLYEEWLHKHMHFQDESRSMQNHLLNQLMRTGMRRLGRTPPPTTLPAPPPVPAAVDLGRAVDSGEDQPLF